MYFTIGDYIIRQKRATHKYYPNPTRNKCARTLTRTLDLYKLNNERIWSKCT